MFSFCYGLALVGALVIALAVFIFTTMGWCFYPHHATDPSPSRNANEKQQVILNPHIALKFMYKKVAGKASEKATEADCIVCLTSFEDGEDVQQLPRCRHTFHAACIEMWLYSHSECPLCRVSVDRLASLSPDCTPMSEENSREILLDQRISL
ncbi:Zinc finger, RING-type [Dillenia turbinata]|uniref:Zinc finger, RING-type n=1 Tax=Dillenia turbinata TaxID=194707 RepID=A0AAN8UJQ2_9MAGN